jgi:hypothetical protein
MKRGNPLTFIISNSASKRGKKGAFPDDGRGLLSGFTEYSHNCLCLQSVSSYWDDGTRRPICQKKLLTAMKHFSIFHVFTSEEKIS